MLHVNKTLNVSILRYICLSITCVHNELRVVTQEHNLCSFLGHRLDGLLLQMSSATENIHYPGTECADFTRNQQVSEE